MDEPGGTLIRGRRFWLILHPGQESQKVAELNANRVIIGRGEDCDVVLDDPSVSRHHAAIFAIAGARPVLEDLGSANGTFVNGRPLSSPVGFSATQQSPRVELQGGELLQFGDATALVSLLPPPLAGIPEPPRPSAGEAGSS
jgi:pSer/pThr/pTyr-binding forkhead associated (FHA) protein